MYTEISYTKHRLSFLAQSVLQLLWLVVVSMQPAVLNGKLISKYTSLVISLHVKPPLKAEVRSFEFYPSKWLIIRWQIKIKSICMCLVPLLIPFYQKLVLMQWSFILSVKTQRQISKKRCVEKFCWCDKVCQFSGL